MATRNNIGKISKAISAGQKAYDHIDFGPKMDLNYALIDNNKPVGDWVIEDTFIDQFIISIHKWGSTSNKVTK